MTKLLLIGDLHGKWESYTNILNTHNVDRSIQVGDFGWGFGNQHTAMMQQQVEILHETMQTGNHKYFRGNHDNPSMCKDHEYCLPDVHYEENTSIMTIAGADSIDKAWRTHGFDWWPDEELSYDALYAAIDVYEKVKPRIVITHECPESIVGHMFNWYRNEYPSRTREALDSMLAIHQPEMWIFGHWHTSRTYEQNGTKFVCLKELETLTLEI